ncbi:MAG: aminotransferase class I/II-fold pyridoxal phosphate-dependent enzyme [Actinobacteria bacterium]|nr:aminotransferase class I/II-fold pyridoxal phosphate-dependent enzyme [Actinomycetota bacterium]
MSELPHPIRPALAAVNPYVPGRPAGDLRRELGLDDVLKLASNESPFPPMPAALAAIAEAAGNNRSYPEADGALRDAIAAWLGVAVGAVITGAGVDSLINLISVACLDAGDGVLLGWPSFVSWRQRSLIQGADLTLVPLRADGSYDLDAMLAAVRPHTKLVVIVSPNNPTGGAVDADEFAAFLSALPPHVLPVLDEAYFEYQDDDGHDGVALVRSGRRMLVARTFSKAFSLAGLRIGYVVGPEAIVHALSRARNAFDVNAVAQAAAIASLGEAEAHLPGRVALVRSERERLRMGLAALGLAPFASQGNFVFVEFGRERAQRVNAALLARGVIVRPTGPFGAPGGLRFTLGWPDENARLLRELNDAVAANPA